jgi:hypothetical protein
MQAWLLGADDAESDAEIWGTKEPNVTQLEAWMNNQAEQGKLDTPETEKKKKKKKKSSRRDKGKQKEV